MLEGRKRKWTNALLVGCHVVGRLGLLQWVCSAAVEVVDAHSDVSARGRSIAAVEVGQEVDCCAVVLSSCKDTRNGDSNIWCSVLEDVSR